MDATLLESRLEEWLREFETIGGSRAKLPGFLSRRIVESGLTNVREDPNVVRITVGGILRKRRITGWDQRISRLQYEETEPGYLGMGLCRPHDVHPEDHEKLAQILDQLEGKTP